MPERRPAAFRRFARIFDIARKGGKRPAPPVVTLLAVTLTATALLAVPPARAAEPATADAAAAPVVRALYDAMGGRAGFEKARGLHFTFAVTARDTLRNARSHWWDRGTNDYRIQFRTRDGKTGLLLFNLDTRQGRAWLDGVPQAGEALQKLLDRGWALFINDTYWLLMPAKLSDPGVHVVMDGSADVAGSACDRLKVTFDQVGLTPGDTYWAYVDRKSHLMTRWGMVLQGDRAKADTTEVQYDWRDWKAVGPLTLATTKPAVNDPDRLMIHFPDLAVTDAFPATVFSDTTQIKP